MKYSFLSCALVIAFITMSFFAKSQTFSSEQLSEDFKIMKDAIYTLHGGLYRYDDSSMIDSYFDSLQHSLQSPMTLKQAYLAFSKMVAQIKCGHTYLNYYNQGKAVNEKVFQGENKLPFTFKMIDGEMIVAQNLTDLPQLDGGIVQTVNGVEVRAIADRLLPYLHTDGHNLNQKWYNLSLSGLGEFEAFDIYFPNLFPPENGTYIISGVNVISDEKFQLTVNTISREERKRLLKEKYSLEFNTYDELWKFAIEDNLAIITIGTFATFKMSLDWKGFLKEAFQQIEENNIENVVIDIRDNGGGMDKVSRELLKYTLQNPHQSATAKKFLRADRTPDRLRPYLSTWEKNFYDMRSKVRLTENGNYASKKNSKPITTKPSANRYKGQIFLLINAANSSATFHLAKKLKESKSATLVGQPTGGNLKGTTGSAILFLTLPNTRLEIDIPLISTEFDGPDKGLDPDVMISPNAVDVANGVDTELNYVRQLIKK